MMKEIKVGKAVIKEKDDMTPKVEWIGIDELIKEAETIKQKAMMISIIALATSLIALALSIIGIIK